MCDNLSICHQPFWSISATINLSSPDDIAVGVDVDSMNMSNHVEFDAPQTYDIAETMAARMLEGVPLT